MSTATIKLAEMAVDNLSVHEKQALIRKWTDTPAPIEPDRIVRIRAAADRMSVTPRTIFNLLKSGALTRVKLPGRSRGAGIRNSELTALIEGVAK